MSPPWLVQNINSHIFWPTRRPGQSSSNPASSQCIFRIQTMNFSTMRRSVMIKYLTPPRSKFVLYFLKKTDGYRTPQRGHKRTGLCGSLSRRELCFEVSKFKSLSFHVRLKLLPQISTHFSSGFCEAYQNTSPPWQCRIAHQLSENAQKSENLHCFIEDKELVSGIFFTIFPLIANPW